MNIVNQLTLRALKKNKRRTIVTIMGVIISVAMITAVATLVVSFMDLLQRQEISDNGEWHVLYKDVNEEQLKAIKKDKNTKQVILSQDIGYAELEGSQNKDKPYLFIKSYDLAGFKKYPIKLIDGRLPTKQNEVVISQHIEDDGGVKLNIGDTLNLKVGTRVQQGDGADIKLDQSSSFIQPQDGIREAIVDTEEKTYKIVGIIERPTWENSRAPGYTIIPFLDEATISATHKANASVILNKVDRSLFNEAKELGERIGVKKVVFNNELLRYYGIVKDDHLNQLMIGLAAILMMIIIIGSISLIYNAFAISVSDRSRYLGMLSSVGATKKQKRNSVFFEGAVIGTISIPLGILAGLSGIGITFIYINNMLSAALGITERLRLVISPLSILVAVAVSAFTIFISTYLPAVRASKISAIDAIRQTKDVKLTGKKVKTSKLIRKLFGMEAEIGLKNLKRNKRRYQATVISLVISIVLFLSVSYFKKTMQESFSMTQDGPDYDMSVLFNGHYGSEAKQAFEKITELDGVTERIIMQDFTFVSQIDEAKVPDSVRNYVIHSENGKIKFQVILHALDQSSLQAYAEQIRVNDDLLNQENKFPAIVINKNNYQDIEKKQYVKEKAVNVEVGDLLNLQYEDLDTGKIKDVNKVEIVALTDKQPMGLRKMISPGEIHVVVSEDTLNKLLAEHQNIIDESYYYLYLNSKDPIKTEEQVDEMNLSIQPSIYNVYHSRIQDEQMSRIIQVFVYGFVLLISAVSVANIFNTISTSIALRKREFAMLKSVGMTPKGFNKMLNYESIFYGMKALLYGLPISLVIMYLMYRSFSNSFAYRFNLPWVSLLVTVLGVFIIVGVTMLYSSSKVKKENIIDALKQENI